MGRRRNVPGDRFGGQIDVDILPCLGGKKSFQRQHRQAVKMGRWTATAVILSMLLNKRRAHFMTVLQGPT